MRRHRFIFGTDIVKMFRQIKVHPDDWDLLRILWIDVDGNLIEFQLTTVTYGTTSAPWLSLRVLRQLVGDEGHRYPKAVSTITEGRYVDDMYGGAETEEELRGIIVDLQNLCMAGGFPLQKWTSNSPITLEQLGIQPETSVAIDLEDSSVKVLGLQWSPRSDVFTYKVKKFSASLITKRVVLSEIAQIYDPLGLIAPVIVRAKILMQELWLIKANWDDMLPLTFIKRWQIFREELLQLDWLSIPRWLHLASEYTDIQIHGFADASNLAMGAAVYIRSSSPSSDPVVTLVCAKTRVAPLKRMTIPRLELVAALILTELTTHVKKLIKRADIETHLWTDSSVALTWINGHPSSWKDFVQNRVQKIQDTEPNAQWHHISGKDNPADCASRGINPSQLAQHHLWWTGPEWLVQPASDWPVSAFIQSAEASLEERVSAVSSHPVRIEQAEELINRFSSLNRLLRVTAMVARAIRRFRRQPIINGPVQPREIEEARSVLIKYLQQQHFETVLNRLRDGHSLPANHRMSPLTPFIDAAGILRLGGRLKNSILDPDEKHPSIIPRYSQLSMLIIADAHQRTLHGGTQSTLAFIRQKHWIIGGRAPVRSYILKCVTCARHRATRAQNLMGQLPHRRITPSRPFQHTGVDYAGPMFINKWKGINVQPFKGYICVFVCMATSAIHLEVVTDLTSTEFIAAYKRFTARRGICETLTSDQGRSFVGSERELRELFDEASSASQHIATLLAQDGTQWKFIPAHLPHFGGKWEAAVKSVKHHLKRIIGDQRWTLVELTTLLCQIEAILNSRPLCPLTNDPNDLSVLTPGHFITGAALTTLPEPSLETIEEHRLNRWQRITQRTQIFWRRWSKECIQRYQSIYRWREPRNEIQPGSLVLILQENYPPAKWPLARVIGIRPGRDNLTRVAELRTSSGNVTIAIAKLVPLPINADLLEADQNHHREIPHRDDFDGALESSSSGDDDGGRNVQNPPEV